MNSIEELRSYLPKHEFFIGIDSDGTVFDTMEIKHKQSFIPTAIKLWNLQKVEKEFSDISEKINLYTRLRGINRFLGLEMTFRVLKEKGIEVPDYHNLSDFLQLNIAHSRPALFEYNRSADSGFLDTVIQWSDESDLLFDVLTKNIRPFDQVKDTIRRMSNYADIMVVSSASDEGLRRDWENAGLMNFAALGAGQNIGSKKEQLKLAADGKYDKNKILMIGDAPGDMEAALGIGSLFYPIKVKEESSSWRALNNVYFNKFLSLEYTPIIESQLINEFLKLLPVFN